MSNTPYREYKNWSHEGGIKTPLIAYWPEKIKNKGFVSHKPIHFIDFLPTLQALSGAHYPKNYNGDTIFPSPGKSFYLNCWGTPPAKEVNRYFGNGDTAKLLEMEIGN